MTLLLSYKRNRSDGYFIQLSERGRGSVITFSLCGGVHGGNMVQYTVAVWWVVLKVNLVIDFDYSLALVKPNNTYTEF